MMELGSGFTTANDYSQGGGVTLVDGTLTATGGQVNINGGTLIGTLNRCRNREHRFPRRHYSGRWRPQPRGPD